VLVVDDEASVRSTITRVLEHLGLSVLSAPDGSSALEVFQSHLNVIDCVLLDLTMPGMPGTEVARAMRAIHPSLPIVLMSGYNQEDMARSMQEVMNIRFLHKPFLLVELDTALQWVFAMWGTSRELGK
jgi:CheY-like chemotaxis protein